MRKHGLFLGAACIAVSSASMAFNPVQGWYVGGIGLVSYTPSFNFYTVTQLTTPSTALKGELTYRVGGGGGGQIGYRCAPWRFEGEIIFNINSYSKLTINGTQIKRLNNDNATTTPLSLKGDTYILGAMINAIYDLYQVQFSQDSQIVPYAGIGIGYVSVKNELRLYQYGVQVNPTVINGISVNPTIKESSSEGAVQFIIGAQYFADDYTSLGIDYRYIATGNVGNTNDRYTAHTANLTLNFAFDSSDS